MNPIHASEGYCKVWHVRVPPFWGNQKLQWQVCAGACMCDMARIFDSGARKVYAHWSWSNYESLFIGLVLMSEFEQTSLAGGCRDLWSHV